MRTLSTPYPSPSPATARPSPLHRFAGVVARPGTYRNLAYLLLGLPLGTTWFVLLVTGISVAVSLLVVALVGVPLLLCLWYVARVCANVERGVAQALLGVRLPAAPLATAGRGNVWVRLRTLSSDRYRWREVAFLLVRFPAGVATFTAAVTAVATPVFVALAPVTARIDDHDPFGHWFLSDRFEHVASSTWAWFLVPAGIILLPVALHLLNALATACGRWASGALAPASR